ncbi:MAG: WD40 repeat domain-containing protein [Pseudonocardiaceae bacterium]
MNEVATAVAREVGIEAHDSDSLLVALSDRKPSPPLGVVVDAVDEAAAPERLVRELLVPLARMAERAGVRLLVGTRPGQDRRLVRAFGRDAVEIDLDSATYLEEKDLVGYAERLLLTVDEDEGQGRGLGTSTPYRRRPELAPTVARAIAARAGRSFLVAHLSSLALAQAPDVVDTTQPGWEMSLPHNADEAMEQYLDRFQTNRARVRDLLMPLAFAEGDGIGDPDVWARLATALGTASYTAADVGWLLSDTTGPDLLTRVEVADGLAEAVAYRLFHEALAEHLRAAITFRMSVGAVSRSFAAVLVNAVPTRPDGSGRQWTKADQYTRTYLSVHAAAGGVFDDLACDLSFVAVAEPSRLLQALPAVTSAEGRRVAEAMTRVGRQLLLLPARERLAYLELAARKSGDSQLADRVNDFAPDRPWSVPWACWAAPTSGRTIGHHGLYIQGLTLMSLSGREIVAAADRTVIRLWDPQTASAVGELADPGLADIQTMTVTSTDTGPRVVTGHADGTIAFWNPTTGSCITREAAWQTHSGYVTVIRLDHDLVVSDGTGANLTLWRASDAAPVGSIAIPPRAQLHAAGRVHDIDLAILAQEKKRTVHLWNITKQEAVGEPLVLEKGQLWACTFGVVDGTPVVFTGINSEGSASSDAGSSVRNTVSWPATKQALPDAGWGPMSVALRSTAEQTALSIGGADGVLRRFTWTEDRFVLTSKVTAHDGGIDNVAFWNHNGHTIEITGGRDGAIRAWQALNSDPPTNEPWPYLRGNRHVLANANAGMLLLGPDRDGRLSRWDATTGGNLGAMPGLSEHTSSSKVCAMTACRVGDRPVVVAGYDDGSMAILDLNSGVLIDKLVVSDSAVVALCVAPSPGAPVVVCSTADGAISCYELDQATWITRGSGLYDSGAEVDLELDTTHLDSRRVAVTSGYDVSIARIVLRLWDIDSSTILNESLATLEVDDNLFGRHGGPFAAGYVDGQPVAVRMGGGSAVRVWDLRSGELIKTGFIEDGHRMASHGVSIDRLHGHDVIISGGYAGALSIWNLSGTIRTTIEVGYSTSGWHVIPPDSIIVGGPMGILKLRLTPSFFDD